MTLTLLADLAARAGGGHSFSGGGGASRSSGGGGGFFFVGGGGGGGAGSILGIIFLIIIVLIVLAVVASVRKGRMGGSSAIDAATQGYGGSARPSQWTGSDQSAAIDGVRGDVFPGTDPVAHAASPVQDGIGAIQAHDPEFNEEVFLEQVQKAFFLVEEAWTERKPDMSRRVMADGVWQTHRTQIEQYVTEHKRNVLEDLAVGDLRILSAHSDSTYDTITVRVFAACADYDVNDESGKVVRGDKSVGQWQEDWTFQRSSQATTKPGGGSFMSNKCPNCGAPLDVDLQGVCKYCHQPIMSGKYDWVLARIAQVM